LSSLVSGSPPCRLLWSGREGTVLILVCKQEIILSAYALATFLYEKLLFVNGYQDLIGQPLFCLFPIGIGIGISIGIGIGIVCMTR
jgi:hypothetical protein